MNDDNWELINGAPAHHIEHLNGANVLNVIEAIVTFSVANQHAQNPHPMPSPHALLELHRSGTLFLLNKPGEYRDVDVNVQNTATGQVIHQPPPFQEVEGHMDDFFKELDEIWENGDALDAASFALWRICWIHPFKNGNGRTARAFCYACLSARLGVVLPGAPTVIEQIMTTRPQYEAAIRVGDAAVKADSKARDLTAMKSYLDGLLQIQMAGISN